jgi:hypothetical protein
MSNIRHHVADTYYDPERGPVAAEWLALSESEKLRTVANFHTSSIKGFSGAKEHAALHVVVETQLASGFGPSKRAILRLQRQGLTRHESIHAIAEVVRKCLSENPVGANAVSAKVMQARMNKELDALSAEARDA